MNIEALLQSARTELIDKNYEQALATCQQVLSQSPQNALAFKIIGDIYATQHQFNEAMSAYNQAIELQPNWAEPYAYLAQLYRNFGWLDEAETFYKKALERKPGWTEMYCQIGHVFLGKGDIGGAIACYKKAIQQAPHDAEGYFHLGTCLGTQGSIESAIAAYKQALALCPTSIGTYNNLGCLLLNEQRYTEALEIFQQAIAISPKRGILHNNLAQALIGLECKGEAITAYQKAIEVEPDLILAYQNLGKLWQQQNQHQTALAYFKKIIELAPDDMQAYSDAASCLFVLRQLESTLICFQRAIALDPRFVEGFCQEVENRPDSQMYGDELSLSQRACARFFRKLQQYDFKSQSSDKSPTLESIYQDWANIYFYLGNTLFQYGEFKNAADYYQKAIQIKPQAFELYWALAESFLKDNRVEEATIIYQIANQVCTRYFNEMDEAALHSRLKIYWRLGQIAEKQKRWESALEYYSKVLQFQQDFSLDLPQTDFPTDSASSKQQIPQGVVASTWDWLTTHNLQNSHYISLPTQTSGATIEPLKETESPPKCGGLDCGVCLKRIEKEFDPKPIGSGLYHLPKLSKLEVELSPKFVATIPNGRAWIVPQQNYWMICNAIAIITPDDQLLADVSREYPGQLPGCSNDDPTQHRIFNTSQLPPLESIEGRVAVLSGLSGNVYFHWIVDILPRLELLRRSGMNWDTIDWFVVNSLHLPFQRETLKQLGIPEFKILDSDRIPHFQAQQLIVPSFAGYLGWIEPWAIEFLRREFLKGVQVNRGNYPERIYIRRRKANHRRILNEEEIIGTLRPFGFVDLDLETLSFTEQIALFSQAKVILTPHGSGLTNTIFCSKEGTKVIEIVSPHYNRHYYWVISQYLKLEHYYLVGESFGCYPLRSLMYQNPLTEDIWVNQTSLKKLIRTIGLQ